MGRGNSFARGARRAVSFAAVATLLGLGLWLGSFAVELWHGTGGGARPSIEVLHVTARRAEFELVNDTPSPFVVAAEWGHEVEAGVETLGLSGWEAWWPWSCGFPPRLPHLLLPGESIRGLAFLPDDPGLGRRLVVEVRPCQGLGLRRGGPDGLGSAVDAAGDLAWPDERIEVRSRLLPRAGAGPGRPVP